MNRDNALQVKSAADIDCQHHAIESSPAQTDGNATPSAPIPETIWQQHCMNAVRSFLKNVVIVDNEPYTPPQNTQAEKVQAPEDDGMGPAQATADLIPPPLPQEQGNVAAEDTDLPAHRLDIIEISDSFADAGLSCAFVLPKDADTDSDAKKKRALKAAKAADVLIIDWQLEKNSPELTKEILKELAEQDVNEGNRLRLICVYTANNVTVEILNEAVSALRSGGIDLSTIDNETAKSATCLLAIVNKYAVPSSDLPEKIVTLFTKLNDGLIPSFALASVGAIRKNTHHLLSRFESGLDSAYIANRLITDPPEDIAELMRDLLVAECENSLSYDAVADNYLTSKPIANWLQAKWKNNADAHDNKSTVASSKAIKSTQKKVIKNRATIANNLDIDVKDVQNIEQALVAYIETIDKKEKTVSIKKQSDVNMEILSKLLEYGINERGIKLPPSIEPKIDIKECDRKYISISLSGTIEGSIQSENKFSRMVALRREAFGSHKAPWNESWLPSITTGTILKLGNSYYICLTPACDTLRLKSDTAFAFIKAEKNQEKYSLVIKDEDGTDLHIKYSTKNPEIFTFNFPPDTEKKRVLGKLESDDKKKSIFKFTSTDKQKFIWMGEMRYGRAVSEIAKISSNWMRIGLIDSEHLRIAAKENGQR